jgi:peptidoglycan/LPS O-acetylase OafA/YrhL
VLIGTISLLVVLRFSLEPDSVELSASLSAAATFLLIWPAFALCAPSTWARWLTLPLCWAGVVSYSLYIWHYLLVNIMSTEEHYRTMQSLFGVVWANDYGRAFVFTAFVMLVSAASYFLIERPSMTSLRTWLIRVVSRPRPIKQQA